VTSRTPNRRRVAELCAELGITPQALAAIKARSGQSDEWLTVEEICAELKVSRRTFDRRQDCLNRFGGRLGRRGRRCRCSDRLRGHPVLAGPPKCAPRRH
jgi:hypothetical protein